MIRQKIIAGNWKMNNTITQTTQLLNEIVSKTDTPNCKFIICTPFTSLQTACELTKNSIIEIGAQNCHYEQSGAFTGEISTQMLTDIGVKYVIVGHSERRECFFETDEIINKKIKALLHQNLTPIFCVGETLSERENKIIFERIATQIKLGLNGISATEAKNIIIAYEPIWAIGTGKTASSEQAEEICKFIRFLIKDLYNDDISENISIIYGGSMNEMNAKELLFMPNIDGGLIGGASLKSDVIINITKYC